MKIKRKHTQYEAPALYLGFDIGGSALKFGWGSSQLGLQSYHRINLKGNRITHLKTAANEAIRFIKTQIDLSRVVSIGIGTPGTINRTTHILEGINPNLPEWTNLDPVCLIPPALDIPAFTDNDANLMALAEASALSGKTHVIGITIGSGIGCGFISEGRIFHGAHGYAMELGHTTVKKGGALCNCGRKGCLEAYASVNGLRNIILTYNTALVIENMVDILALSKIDKYVKFLVNRSIDLLSSTIANLVIVLDADAVILGGGVIELSEYPGDRLITGIESAVPQQNRKNVWVRKAALGNKAGTWGALLLAEQSFSALGNGTCI